MPDAPAAYAVNCWMARSTGEVRFYVAGARPPVQQDFEFVGSVIIQRPFDQRLAAADAHPTVEVPAPDPVVQARGHTAR